MCLDCWARLECCFSTQQRRKSDWSAAFNQPRLMRGGCGAQLEDFQKWLAAQVAAQSKKAGHDDPAWTSSDASQRLDAVRKVP